MTRCRPPFEALVLVLAAPDFVPSTFAQHHPQDPLQEPVPPREPLQSAAAVTPTAGQAVGAVREIGWGWEPGLVLDGGWEQNIRLARHPGPDDLHGFLSKICGFPLQLR